MYMCSVCSPLVLEDLTPINHVQNDMENCIKSSDFIAYQTLIINITRNTLEKQSCLTTQATSSDRNYGLKAQHVWAEHGASGPDLLRQPSLPESLFSRSNSKRQCQGWKKAYLVMNVSILASSQVIPTVMSQGFAESSFNQTTDFLHSETLFHS